MSDAAIGSALLGQNPSDSRVPKVINYSRIWVRMSPFANASGISLANWKKNPSWRTLNSFEGRNTGFYKLGMDFLLGIGA